MGFLPVAASENIRNKYMRYLKTIFSIDNEVYSRQFQKQLDETEILSAGPYLDVSDSFEKGKSIEGLIEECEKEDDCVIIENQVINVIINFTLDGMDYRVE